MKRVCFLTSTVIRGGHLVSDGASPPDVDVYFTFTDLTSHQGRERESENHFPSS